MQKTLVIAKPDAIQRGHIGEIITRMEKKGIKLIGLKMIHADDKLLSDHYAEHSDKPFFDSLKDFMASSPIVVMAWEGLEVVPTIRRMVGSTNGREAEPGSIRGDFGMSGSNNIVHASDSEEAGVSEVERFFTKEEIFDYQKDEYVHVYGDHER